MNYALLNIIIILNIFNEIFTSEIALDNSETTIDTKETLKKFHREIPKSYIDKAIDLFKQKNGKIIVELGSMRFNFSHNLDLENCDYCMDGHSTLLWARTEADVYSVDIDPKAFEFTNNSCKDYKNVKIILSDALEFLKNFNKPIDLLYLDAWDAIPGTDYAEKHLEAYQIAKKNLHEDSLILIDDTDILDGGKSKLIIPKALEDGYKIIFSGRQTLLKK